MKKNIMLVPTAKTNNGLADIVLRDGLMEIKVGRIRPSKDTRGPWVSLRTERHYFKDQKVQNGDFFKDDENLFDDLRTNALSLLVDNKKISDPINAWPQDERESLAWNDLGLKIIIPTKDGKKLIYHSSTNFNVKGELGIVFNGFRVERSYRDNKLYVKYPSIIWGDNNNEYPLVEWNCPIAKGIFEQNVIQQVRKDMDSAPIQEKKAKEESAVRRQTAEKSPDNQEQAIGAIAD